jgi:hypothetical protein
MVLDLSGDPVNSALEVRADGDGVVVGRKPWSADDPLIALTRRAFRDGA